MCNLEVDSPEVGSFEACSFGVDSFEVGKLEVANLLHQAANLLVVVFLEQLK